ncbi:MAG: terminase small subunit protein [Burkholderiales bacterium]|nr:terminase small subunit protein [Burkholderiales bacterium]
MGRPSKMTEDVISHICEEIALGRGLCKIVGDEGMPDERTVYRWLEQDEAFRQKYADARARAMEKFADEIVEIADDGRNDKWTDDEGGEHVDHDVIARSRLRVDTRKWLMSKLAPKKYGDRLDVNASHSGGVEVKIVSEFGG